MMVTNAYKVLSDEKMKVKYDERCFEKSKELEFGGRIFKIKHLIL